MTPYLATVWLCMFWHQGKERKEETMLFDVIAEACVQKQLKQQGLYV